MQRVQYTVWGVDPPANREIREIDILCPTEHVYFSCLSTMTRVCGTEHGMQRE